MIRSNFLAVREEQRARQALELGVAATLLLLGIALVLPERFPNSVLPAIYTFGTLAIAKALDQDRVKTHGEPAVAYGSNWRVAAIGFVCLLIVFVALLAFLLVLPEEWIPE